jgi:hypothetical protein
MWRLFINGLRIYDGGYANTTMRRAKPRQPEQFREAEPITE